MNVMKARKIDRRERERNIERDREGRVYRKRGLGISSEDRTTLSRVFS